MHALRFSRVVWAVLILGTLSFFGFRLLQLLHYGDPVLFSQQQDDLLRAFWLGARFDFKMLAWVLLLLFVPIHLILLLPWLRRASAGVQLGAIAFLFFLVNFAATCQYFYYDFYKARFSPLIFGFYEDDTRAVVALIADKYPVLLALLMVLAVTAMQTLLTYRWARLPQSQQTPTLSARRVGLTVVTLLLLAFFARGQWYVFPLYRDGVTVLPNPFINDLVWNAWHGLWGAVKDRRVQIKVGNDPTAQLNTYGFSSLDELAHTLGARSGSAADLEAFIYRRTPSNAWLAQHPPHVVFALMESWGAHPLKLSHAKNDFMGALGKYLKRGPLFENFFSAQLGTHPALEALLVNTPLSPLTQAENGYFAYPAAALKPFKEQGYRTVMIYGGDSKWRQIGRAMQHQYFDEFYDASHIRARYPEASQKETVWKVQDEYLFHFAFDLLQEAEKKGEKIFLFLLTATNHAPNQVPPHYQRLPLDLASLRPRFSSKGQTSENMAWTYQYANHQLGLFLDQIDQSGLKNKTLLVASGDHNRAFLKYNIPTESKDLYSVPAYFYLPQAYRPAFAPDTDRFAGHRDLFPTLYNLALSDAVYPGLGNNLFTKQPPQQQFAVINNRLMFSREGALLPFVGSYPSAFKWDKTYTTLTSEVQPAPLLSEQGKRARALLALTDWYTRYQVIQAHKHPNAVRDASKLVVN